MLKTLRKGKWKHRGMAMLMALLMVVSLLPTGLLGEIAVTDASETKYVFESKDLAATAAGTYTDGQEVTAGTEEYFTLYMSTKAKIDTSDKTWDDGYESGQRVNFGGKADATTPKNVIGFETKGSAVVKIWWASGGDGRQMGIYGTDGSQKAITTDESAKNSVYMSTLTLEEAGKYFLGGDTGSNYIFKVEVTDTVEEEPVISEYVFESKDLAAVAAGTYTDGQEVTAGTEDYFTLYMSTKAKIDTSEKTWDDGYESGQRVNFGGKADATTPKNVIGFETKGSAVVKIWWASGGDGRQMGIYGTDGSQKAITTDESAKNSVYMSTLTLEEAGKYFLGGDSGSNYIFKVEVTDTVGGSVEESRADWSKVDAPVLGSPSLKDGKAGTIVIPYTMLIGKDGADSVVITVKDSAGNEIKELKSLVEGADGSKEFTPDASGTYTFSIKAIRENEEDKIGSDVTFTFSLPLETPVITSVTSLGQGKMEAEWSPVTEAESYNVYVNGELKTNVKDTVCTISGLTVGTKYNFQVEAVRGDDKSAKSDIVAATVTAAAQQKWAITVYGPSTSSSTNGYTGSLSEDGKVTVFSESGKGKIQSTVDGLAFYYTQISSDLNFTLRAKVTVDSWTYSNGQEGFGIMAADALGENGTTGSFWNNAYMAVATKVEYTSEITGAKYSMKLGLGVLEKVGITKQALEDMTATGAAQPEGFTSSYATLDTTPDKQNLAAGTYNIFGNLKNKETSQLNCIDEITEVILEIQRNNTGYFVTYYDEAGNVLNQIKYYDTEALDQIDSENVYVGFFASRNARATFSEITLTTIDPKDDIQAEERPVEKVTPTLNIPTADITNSSDYTLSFITNVDGTININLGDKVVASGIEVKADEKVNKDVTIDGTKAEFTIEFTPDPNQDLGEYKELASTDKIVVTKTVTWNKRFEKYNNIYVGPNADSTGKGTYDNPVDIYTAVACAQPGQTIVILEGTYLLEKTIRIERGMDGTKESPIRMVADPQAKSRPVFDFQSKCAGMVFGGDYWYFNGFDVTKSANGQKGLQISGSNNILDNVNAYYNGNTGIQISRLYGTDLWEDWPANNLVLNCTSHGNADSGYEDADGFAAKLTVADGNVFDGCIAYNNADDGWDLFAKTETGSIGAVTIKNCVAYNNGYLEDGTNAGNGNGFKMGGSSLSGKHMLINSIAYCNKAKGIDSNSCPDIIVRNCITYNNESYNVAFYTNDASNTNFDASGIISFKDESIRNPEKSLSIGENIKLKGNQLTATADLDAATIGTVYSATNYYWNGTKSENNEGTVLASDWAISFEVPEEIERNADGTINMQQFLALSETAPTNAGAKMSGTDWGGTASAGVVLEIDQYGDFASEYIYILVLLGAAFVTAGFFAKKRYITE